MTKERLVVCIALALGVGNGVGACASHPDAVCQDIGYCKAESDDQVSACQAQAGNLFTEAASAGCSALYDAYFACADDRYDCQGDTPVFPGCEPARGALDACLALGRAHSDCGALATALGACPGAATPPDPSTPPAACGAAEVCSAHCYLTQVADVCRPQPAEITQAARCSGTCPL